MKTSIYFIAILPPEKVQKEITAFKQLAAKNFNTKRALTSPPHITLVPPFRVEDDEIQKVIEQSWAIAQQQTAFQIELKDFNCFAPRVIYVDVMSSKTMTTFHQALNQHLEDTCGIEFEYKDRDFHPHMTVAFKDLKEQIFPKAWKYFRRTKYQQVFEANRLTILKHDGKEWQVFEDLDFKEEIKKMKS